MKEPDPATGYLEGEPATPPRPSEVEGKALARLMEFRMRRGGMPGGLEASADADALADSDWLLAADPGVDEPPAALSGIAPVDAVHPPAVTGERLSPYLRAHRQATHMRSMMIGAAAPSAGEISSPFAVAPGATPAAALPVMAQWRPLGPFAVPHGQTYGDGPDSRPSVAGRVSAVAVDPGDDRHLLIACAGGGIWQSFDQGAIWEPRTDDQPSLSVGALAFDPSDRTRLFAGTGEGDTFSPLGVGVLRSTDGGSTWEIVAETPFQGVAFYELLIDPDDGDHLLAGTTQGLWESTNGGVSWSQRRSSRTWSLSFGPPDAGSGTGGGAASTREVLAGCRDGVFRSVDGGTTWSAVAVAGLTQPDRIEVCHAPSDRRIAYVFAAVPPMIQDPLSSNPNRRMPTPLLARRSAAGGTFASFPAPSNLQTGQAFYDWFAAVSPGDADTLYVAGINVHRGERSSQGNWTWFDISARTTGDSIHPDQHAIAFAPDDPSTIYVGNDGGLYVSNDRGETWRALNKGLNITEFEYLAQHPTIDAWLLGGTQDNGTLRYEGVGLWHHVQDGDGGDCGVNAGEPRTCFHTFFGMGLERSTTGGGWGSWQFIGPPIQSANETYPNGSLFYPPVEVHGSLVVQAGRSVFLSLANGDPQSWRKINLPAAAGRASALSAASNQRVLVGTENGRVYRVDRVSGIWRSPVLLGRPANGFLSDLQVEPGNLNRVWATFSQMADPGVFRSDDGGQSWTRVDADLPRIPINTVTTDPDSPDTVFVGGDVGVYRSFDAGQSWAPFFDGLPNVLVHDLLFHPGTRQLRAATQSRGVWEIDVDRTVVPEVEIYVRDSVVDTGRRVPSASGVADPFEGSGTLHWWQCPDIKVDSSPFLTSFADEVDFQVFGDDRDLVDGGIQFATGLRHESVARGETVRVFAQVHNRGLRAAATVSARVYFAELGETASGLTVPSLEAGFFDQFPLGDPGSASAWQPIGAAAQIAEVLPGRSRVAGFEWRVPDGLAEFAALMVAVGADNDGLEVAETRVTVLAPGETKIGFKVIQITG